MRTEEFTVFGDDRLPVGFPTIFPPLGRKTVELSAIYSPVSKACYGAGGQPKARAGQSCPPTGAYRGAQHRGRTRGWKGGEPGGWKLKNLALLGGLLNPGTFGRVHTF